MVLATSGSRAAPYPSDLTEEEANTLRRVIDVLDMMTALKGNIPVYQVATLLRVALKEGHNVLTYAEMSGLPASTMSRALLDLGKMSRKREPGLMLVDDRPAAHSLREHEIFLTQKGKSLVKRVAKKLMN